MRTKVIVTLGPSSANYEMVENFLKRNIDGLRINFAHTPHNVANEWINMIRKAENATNRKVAIIGDLRGASIRLGIMDKPLEVWPGMKLRLEIRDRARASDYVLPLPQAYEVVFKSLEPSDIISMDDGRIRLRVLETSENYALVKAETKGTIKSHRALVVVGKDFDLPVLTSKDIKDLEFMVKKDFTYIGISCVRKPQDIDVVRKYIEELGKSSNDIRIIAKIETISAIKNLTNIIEKSDAILVARGDLGMIFGLENIPHLQKEIVYESIKRGRTVIVATQLLDSMINNPIPTRSEVVDIVEAVHEGADALMLTNETAIGKYPLEAIEWLQKIIKVAETKVYPPRIETSITSPPIKFAKGIVDLAGAMSAKLIVFSVKGTTARNIVRFRPRTPLIVGTNKESTLRALRIVWGVEPVIVEAKSYDEGLEKVIELAISTGFLRKGEVAVASYGLIKERMHLIKLLMG
ncbi:MAG: pyruvate kinase [Thermoprotei archaeon]|nr:MAG: pyruvate kinase [Thermoprotei archaeon]